VRFGVWFEVSGLGFGVWCEVGHSWTGAHLSAGRERLFVCSACTVTNKRYTSGIKHMPSHVTCHTSPAWYHRSHRMHCAVLVHISGFRFRFRLSSWFVVCGLRRCGLEFAVLTWTMLSPTSYTPPQTQNLPACSCNARHVSRDTCHVSRDTCHVLRNTCHVLRDVNHGRQVTHRASCSCECDLRRHHHHCCHHHHHHHHHRHLSVNLNGTNDVAFDRNSGSITTSGSITISRSSSNIGLQPAGIACRALAHAAAFAAQIQDVVAKVFVTRERAGDAQVVTLVVVLSAVVMASEARVYLLAGRSQCDGAARSLAGSDDEHFGSA